jgi:hypothetical protein
MERHGIIIMMLNKGIVIMRFQAYLLSPQTH